MAEYDIDLTAFDDASEIIRDLKAVADGDIFEPHLVRPILIRGAKFRYNAHKLWQLAENAKTAFVLGDSIDNLMGDDYNDIRHGI